MQGRRKAKAETTVAMMQVVICSGYTGREMASMCQNGSGQYSEYLRSLSCVMVGAEVDWIGQQVCSSQVSEVTILLHRVDVNAVLTSWNGL